MPSPRRHLTVEDVHEHVAESCFSARGPDRIGIELEWLTVSTRHPGIRISPATLSQALLDGGAVTGASPTRSSRREQVGKPQPGALPGGSCITFEPGGQLELSSPPRPTLAEAIESLANDLTCVRRVLSPESMVLVGLGLDPLRTERRMVRTPRYAAMESFFDRHGTEGRTMMCNTAAVQANLDMGGSTGTAERWRLAHAIGPTLAASFANSPFIGGTPSGWRSTRLGTWWSVDPSRTKPANGSIDPIVSWSTYALEARVMLIRVGVDSYIPMHSPLSFAEWMVGGHELGWPTQEDLEYHLTTLFPPVRPKGWLELRMVDALPGLWWRAAVAVAAALLYDEDGARQALESSGPAAGLWVQASRHGLSHPDLAASARRCFEIAEQSIMRMGADPTTITALGDFRDRYVEAGRCPADDRLEAWVKDGSFFSDDDLDLEATWN